MPSRIDPRAALSEGRVLLSSNDSLTVVGDYMKANNAKEDVYPDLASGRDKCRKIHAFKTKGIKDAAVGRISDNGTVAARSMPDFSEDAEIIPTLQKLSATVAKCVNRLERSSNLEKLWHEVRTALKFTLSSMASALPSLPSFGDTCDDHIVKLLPQVLSFASTLEEAEDAPAQHSGVPPHLSRMTPHTPPFHLVKACAGRSALGTAKALERTVYALEHTFLHLPVWSAAGGDPGNALRVLMAELANRSAELRGRLIGAWPELLLAGDETGVGLWSKKGRGGPPRELKAKVLGLKTAAPGRAPGVWANVRFEDGPAGACAEWVPKADWGARFRPAGTAWPGGSGQGGLSDDDSDDRDEEWSRRAADGAAARAGGAGVKRRRRT